MLKINGQTKLLGVLGNPIQHTKSPAIHNYSAEQLGINCCYVPLEFQGVDLKSLLDSLWHLGFVGLNVTVPFKETVAELFPSSGLTSVNTLYRGDSWWQVASTDGNGFISAVNRQVEASSFDAFVMLGNGGAAYAVLTEWHRTFPEMPLVVLRRNSKKDRLFEQALGRRLRFESFSVKSLQGVLQKYPRALLVQGSSAPLHGDDLQSLCPAMDMLKGAFVDMLYGETVSALLPKAQLLAIPAMDGLGMLIGQALLSQRYWWQQSADFDELEDFLRSKLS
ncbi:shikimate dehydrogenase family protein [Pseudobacteriovorax antillogorgiicola]|uniref:shikimate dehydrogenase family protein n=1 Tax=Pseudobacteriovorax antillogorgiicola TaxID=1513793 RepID=UPI001356355C|nr:hypothetical protein [Pseudobacteriovorax antillogorgiicola]